MLHHGEIRFSDKLRMDNGLVSDPEVQVSITMIVDAVYVVTKGVCYLMVETSNGDIEDIRRWYTDEDNFWHKPDLADVIGQPLGEVEYQLHKREVEYIRSWVS